MQIRQYIVRRLLMLPLIMLGVSVVVFTLTRFTGSPVGIYATPNMSPAQVAALEARYHLDDPIPVQYVYWLGGVLRGDLGWSGVSVAQRILRPLSPFWRRRRRVTLPVHHSSSMAA